MVEALVSQPLKDRYSVPAQGRTLSAATEERGFHVRNAANLLAKSVRPTDAISTLFDSRWIESPTAEPSLRTGWCLVAMWLLAKLNGREARSFQDVESWFFGKHQLPSLASEIHERTLTAAIEELNQIEYDDQLVELMPYILDAHGPGSRISVMRDPSTKKAQNAKRKDGIFYTPADVAEYMVDHALDLYPRDRDSARILDPSCGTGVFLLAALRALAGDHDPLWVVTERLFGIDINPLTIDKCAFVLLNRCISSLGERSPWSAWHAIRLNLAVCDAFRVRVGQPTRNASHVQRIREELLSDRFLPAGIARLDSPILCPGISQGADIVIGNPPYADLGARPDHEEIVKEFASAAYGFRATANSYTFFLEMMWRLAKPGNNSSGLVVPLSIAFHQGNQFRRCREAMSRIGGMFQFAFFDREPHALFGEDVKTRNAVVFHRASKHDPKPGENAVIQTGPLRKWTSRNRKDLFKSIDFTDVGPAGIRDGIPKIDGKQQAKLFCALSSQVDSLASFWESSTSCRAADAQAERSVFLASTAYNFLNVYRTLKLSGKEISTLTENKVLRVDCATDDDACAVFAILSSRLTYWLWHVHGDGFHVTSSFVAGIPFGPKSLSRDALKQLVEAGRTLWTAVQSRRIVSLNKGRTTVAFRPLGCEEERDAVDRLLLEAAGLPTTFLQTLRSFVKGVVVVDENDSRREHLKTFFKHDAEDAVPIATTEIKEKSKVTKEEWREYTKTVWQIANTSHSDHPAVFPIEIPRRLIKLFSFWGDTVLDPFAGVGTTAQAAIPIGRKVVCVEQSDRYVKTMKLELAGVRDADRLANIIHGDSRTMSFVKDNSVGIIVTSPPYWNKADYGSSQSNLGAIENYQRFLYEIRPVFEECYRILQPGRKMCVVTAHVNQHTDHGLLTFPLATDFTVLARELGFVLVNEIIWNKDGTGGKWGSYGQQRPIFGSYPYPPNFHFKNVHEYILILAKPSTIKTKGPKALVYSELMKVYSNGKAPANGHANGQTEKGTSPKRKKEKN